MDALLLVDLQKDFMPDGTLPVPEGDQTVVVANRLMPEFDLVYVSRDWHPTGHCSFASSHKGKQAFDVMTLPNNSSQPLWPDHCVQDTPGAAFHPALKRGGLTIIEKGTDIAVDSYSAFYDNARTKCTSLEAQLRDAGITTLYIMGLATDYCVKYSVLDAVEIGFTVYLIGDGCRGVAQDTTREALDLMQKSGVRILHSTSI